MDHYPEGNSVRRAAVVLVVDNTSTRTNGPNDSTAPICVSIGVRWRPEEVPDNGSAYTFGVAP